MTIFLLFALTYGLGYLYVFFKLTGFLRLGVTGDILMGIFLVFMALCPVLIQIYSMRYSLRSSRIFAYTGFLWMGFLIIFAPLSFLLDVYNLIVQQGAFLFGKDISSLAVPQSYTVYVPALISLSFNIFGYFEAQRLRVEKVTVPTRKLPAGSKGITVMQVSDLHLGVLVGERMLKKVVMEFGRYAPDIIVSTGDLLDGAVHHISYLSGDLKKARARMGKFAVMGNHEFYAGLKHATRFLEDSGFTILRGTGTTLSGTVNIAGMDYFTNKKGGRGSDREEADILSGLPPGLFTILLKHSTAVDRKSLGLFDLQLSGHTHKGQIFPVNLLTPFVFRYHHGFTKFKEGSALYVSRGTGTAGPPVRFLSPPELTIIEIVPEGEN